MAKNYPAAAVIAAGVLWGIISVFINKLSAAGMSSMQIASARLIVSAVIFTVFVAMKEPQKLKIRLRDVWMFVGTGIISIVLFFCLYFYTVIHSQPSVAVVLLYTSPVFVMLLSAFLFKEKITRRKTVSLVLTVAGCVLVTGVLGGVKLTPLVALTGLGSGFFYALYTVFGRIALKKYDNLTVTAYTFLFGAVGSLPISGLGKTVSIVAASPEIIPFVIGIAVICTVLPYFLYTWGLQRMESGKAAILACTEPMVGAAVGMIFLGDSRDVLKLIGIALIIFSILFLDLPIERRNKKAGFQQKTGK